MPSRLLAFLLIFLCCCSIAADNPAFSSGLVEIEFNPAKCTVQFTLGAVLHTVHGTFKVKGGNVRFDPASGKANGQITVDVRSGETGENERDRQMHESVLESGRFPDAVFSPDRVKGQLASNGRSQLEVHGTLRIHGGEHEMTIPVQVKAEHELLTAAAKFAVPYVAWGMKDPSNLLLRVDKTVDVAVVLIGTITTHTAGSVRAQSGSGGRKVVEAEAAVN
jgi:polyisoprenoid-binding protein YceI